MKSSNARGHLDPREAVARQPLFASLSERESHGLVDRSVSRAVAPGEVLFREGEPCRGLHIVLEGTVRSYRASADGGEQVLHVLGPGDLLGEVAVFDEGPYLRSARVTRRGRVLFLPMREVQALYREHAGVAHAVVQELGRRVRTLAALVDQLALSGVTSRVADALRRYAAEADALRPGAAFQLPRSQQELAAELGTTREGVARALRALRDAGIIRQRGRRVEVIDPARLA